jgi:hypothetical protein
VDKEYAIVLLDDYLDTRGDSELLPESGRDEQSAGWFQL